MSGVKHDQGKPRTDLVPPEPIIMAAEVFAFGAKKYGERNWEGGISYGRLYGALLRHILAWHSGEELDPESGLPHMGHAMCSLMMLASMAERRPDLDDRPKIGTSLISDISEVGDPIQVKMVEHDPIHMIDHRLG